MNVLMAQTQPEGRKTCACQRCGWTWFPRKDDPAACPKCHSPLWREKKA